jgi:hypothetical protein
MKVKRLEVIQLRLAGQPRAGLLADIRKSAVGARRQSVRLYFNATIPTDLSVHIQSEHAASDKRSSDLGLCLAAELRAYGMVQHSTWIEAGP